MSAGPRRSSRLGCIALALAAAACQTAPRDSYQRGEHALRQGDLAAALRAFDSVAVTDLCYPEARMAAAALEGRLRRHKELLLQGLLLRGEWRDDEALSSFRGALDAWPGHAETRELIAATEQRRRLVQQGALDRAAIVAAATLPTPTPTPLRAPLEPTRIEAVPVTVAMPVEAPPAPAHTEPAPVGPRSPRPASGVDSVGAELAAIEARAALGDLDQMLGALFALHGRAPDDARIGARLARLLLQRGLLRYGQGQVGDAIADWERALQLDPQTDAARALLQMGRRELAFPPR
ncbi:MAG: tetratricopeptide repeat protein [Planctomycetota bacterium]